MFYSPVAFSRASGGYQDRPSPVNNQIRGARKSLLQKAPMARPARGQGAEERGTQDPTRRARSGAPWNGRRILAVLRFGRSRASEMLAPMSKLGDLSRFSEKNLPLRYIGS